MYLTGAKTCGRCKTEKPIAEFSLRRKTGTVRHSYCKDCQGHVMREWLYGVSQDVVEAALLEQEGRCAICRTEFGRPKSSSGMVVDHDHDAGDFRGLLCSQCNKGIGCLRDDVAVMKAAIEYLERAPST